MSSSAKSLFSLRNWLIYAEVLAVVGFVVLASLYIRRGSAEPESPPVSQVSTFIEKADALFAQEDLVDAAFLYWRALQALETAEQAQVFSVNGVSQASAEVDLHANLRIVEIYSRSGWAKDAKARLEQAARIQPDHPEVRLLRGKLLSDEALDDTLSAQAAEEFLAVIESDPNNAEAHYLLAVLYHGNRQLEQAVDHYKQAIESDPEFQDITSQKAPIGILARLQLSRTYARMLQSYQFLDREFTDEDLAEVTRLESESILLLEQAVAKRSEMDEIVADLVRLYFARAAALEREDIETRRYADALQVYERIVTLDPQEVRAWERMAEIYGSFLGDKAKALEMYRRVYEIESHPTVLANIKSLEEDLEAEEEGLEAETE
ncbi:tetratricopeptide repeat protein [Candidatus Poribacteria bacterium]|nr:tetratricopeptide repeat protein [Candidatus Poribacteria bacterium]MYG05595.1 tetratricopeptide repeat protein [Candidatus Poribacteria bacterium]MYK22746.1 tetratricopeptide repeat protein [Candidatus Poribacteria bacterium]